MKQNPQIRRILTLLIVAALMVGSAIAASTVTRRTIEVEYANIKLVVDGAEVTPKDAAGNIVEPFIADGTTYLPVRAVGAALGKEVEWDGAFAPSLVLSAQKTNQMLPGIYLMRQNFLDSLLRALKNRIDNVFTSFLCGKCLRVFQNRPLFFGWDICYTAYTARKERRR